MVTPCHPSAFLYHTPGGHSGSRGRTEGHWLLFLVPQFSFLANGDMDLGMTAWLLSSCAVNLGSQRTSPHVQEEGSWLQSFLSLQPPPGTLRNFYVFVFVCTGEAWASLHHFHSMRPEKGSAQVFSGGRRGSWEPWGSCPWQEAKCACFSEGQKERSMAARLSAYSPLICILAATHALTY